MIVIALTLFYAESCPWASDGALAFMLDVGQHEMPTDAIRRAIG